MKKHLNNFRIYITTHKKEIKNVSIIVCSIVLVLIGIGLFIQSILPKVAYQPAVACDIFSVEEARELLGNNAIRTNNEKPDITDNTAISKCGYTNGNPDMESMIVAAVVVRSGVNDKGVEQNKFDFVASQPRKSIEAVQDVGDAAYFNQANGQFNVLDGRRWIILSYGTGSDPEANTIENAIELARKVLDK